MARKAWVNKSKAEPKFSVRKVNRCSLCGRRHGYIRDFGVCRLCFRELAHKGMIPGLRKSSW